MTKAKELSNSCLSNIQKIHSALDTKARSLKNEEDVREYQRYSYLITRYYKPLSKDQRNGISVATSSFVRVKKKLFLDTNYRVLTGIDGWTNNLLLMS